MSQRFYIVVIALLVAFGGFMTGLHYLEIKLVDQAQAVCKPHSSVRA